MASKQENWPFVINLGNSIIGVSVLAMPFCFKQCGLFLGVLLLCGSAFLTQQSCQLLTKGAHTSRKRSYAYLALHTFGPAGKLCVEISIIGLLFGTCVAFFVIIGDLGPTFISRQLGLENSWNLRMYLMVFLALFVTLPLSFMKNVESLSNISALSLGFYAVFVCEVFITAFPNLWSGVWVTNVVYWKPEGIFKCIPIFSLAFACQTQLFVMYDALSEPSLKRINDITKNAILMCAGVYLCVGYFGYVAFCQDDISGDILLNFKPTIFSECVKLGFVLSVAVSFPLIIFPLRSALYTLLFYREHQKTEMVGPIYIPDFHLKGITFFIVISTLVTGILLPNIEFVLAMTGATMGSMICFIFPAVMFISIMSMSSNHSKATAQFVLFLGVTILLASTYVTLNTQDTAEPPANLQKGDQNLGGKADVGVLPDFVDKSGKKGEVNNVVANNGVPGVGSVKQDLNQVIEENQKSAEQSQNAEDKRQEPPNPQAPLDGQIDEKKVPDGIIEGQKKIEEKIDALIQQEMEQKEKQKLAVLEKPEPQEKQDKVEKEGHVKEQSNDAQKLLNELKDQQKKQEELIKEQKNIIEELRQHQKEDHANKVQANEAQAGQQPVGSPTGQINGQNQVQGVQPPQQQGAPLQGAQAQQQGAPLQQGVQPPQQQGAPLQGARAQQQGAPLQQGARAQQQGVPLQQGAQAQAVNTNGQGVHQKGAQVPSVKPNERGVQQGGQVPGVKPNEPGVQQGGQVPGVKPDEPGAQKSDSQSNHKDLQKPQEASLQKEQPVQQPNQGVISPDKAAPLHQENLAKTGDAALPGVQPQKENSPAKVVPAADSKESLQQLLQNLIKQNNIEKSEDQQTVTTNPLVIELKANLEKFIAEGKSKSSYNTFLQNPNLLHLLEVSENSQTVQALRNLIKEMHLQQNKMSKSPSNLNSVNLNSNKQGLQNSQGSVNQGGIKNIEKQSENQAKDSDLR